MPDISPTVDYAQPDSLFGLQERFAAAESALYLVAQFRQLKENIERCLPPETENVLDLYQEQVCLQSDVQQMNLRAKIQRKTIT